MHAKVETIRVNLMHDVSGDYGQHEFFGQLKILSIA